MTSYAMKSLLPSVLSTTAQYGRNIIRSISPNSNEMGPNVTGRGRHLGMVALASGWLQACPQSDARKQATKTSTATVVQNPNERNTLS